jgi:hypothetical protein
MLTGHAQFFRFSFRIAASLKKPILRRFGCPDGIQVGWGVSEVQAAFVTTAATTRHDGHWGCKECRTALKFPQRSFVFGKRIQLRQMEQAQERDRRARVFISCGQRKGSDEVEIARKIQT